MYENIGELKEGYTELTSVNGKYPDMLQDIGIHTMFAETVLELTEAKEEQAILLLEGAIRLEWNSESEEIQRSCVFEEEPWCLHVPAGMKVTIAALEKSEVLVQKTENEKDFAPKLYTPEDCSNVNAGEGVWDGTADRVIRTIFDYNTAPYSNLVIGEVISLPGRWSSYPPHHHDQPEVYYYRFNKPQGFGCAMVGQDAYRLEHNSFLTIPGGLDHPQATAPGYAMYFCWMIRHRENNPWTERIFEDEHKWLLEENVKIWPEK